MRVYKNGSRYSVDVNYQYSLTTARALVLLDSLSCTTSSEQIKQLIDEYKKQFKTYNLKLTK